MKTKKILAILGLALGLVVWSPKTASAAEPMGTAFTYQGLLYDADHPAEGKYNLEFELYDDPCTGSQVGETLTLYNVDVIGGYFTVQLDFGSDPNCFRGDGRWLEIGIQPGGGGSFTTLSPRQEVTPTPYALALPGLRTQQNATSTNVIGGYVGNSVMAGVKGSAIGGGGESSWPNRVTDDYGTVGGGFGNRAGDDNASPTLFSMWATVGGGGLNTASNDSTTVAGGWGNEASGYYATVAGGINNTASGGFATVGGGAYNTALGSYSFAAGRRAKANHNGTYVWADSTDADFASTGNNQFLIRAEGGVGIGTNSPQNKMDVEGAAAIGAAYSGTNTAPANGMIIEGDMGIGTNSPSEKLEVDGNAKITGDLTVDGSISGNLTNLIRNFIVESGETVTAGDVVGLLDNGKVAKIHDINVGSEYIFDRPTMQVSTCALSETKFVVAYEDGNNSYYGTAFIGEVDGESITFGSEYVFNSAGNIPISVTALSDTKFVVSYRDDGNSNYGTSVIGDVSGSTITFGSEYEFNSGSTLSISAAALSDTNFVVSYRDVGNSDHGTSVIGNVSGSTITFGSEYEFSSVLTSPISTVALSDTKFVVACRLGGDGTAVVGDVSGSTISFGSEHVFREGNVVRLSICAMTDTRVVIVYVGPVMGTAVVGNVSGTSIVFGREYVYDTNVDSFSCSAAALTDNRFIVVYDDGDWHSTAIVGELTGTSVIRFGHEYYFSDEGAFFSAAALSDSSLVVGYENVIHDGMLVVISDILWYKPVGIVNSSASSGETVPVIIQGISDNHSGLVTNRFYYADENGNLIGYSADGMNPRIGLSISSTELLLNIEPE